MRFSVPQFIDVEDKIFGPLTLKQAVYLVGGIGGAYISYAALGPVGVIFIGVPLILFATALGFVKVNNRPSVAIAASAFFFKIKNKLYLWKKADPKQTVIKQSDMPSTQRTVAPVEITQSKLRALALSLDANEDRPQKTE